MPREDESDGQPDQNVNSVPGGSGTTAERARWRQPLVTSAWNTLLVFAPLGLAAGVFNWEPIVTFILNFFAIIPLAPLIVVSTRRLAKRARPAFGGLLKVILGNAVEIIVRASLVRNSFRSLKLLS